MFSSQTKDFRVGQAVRTLQTHGKDEFLTAQTINDMSAETLQEVLKTTPVGFHNNKTKWLKAAAATCLEKVRWSEDRSEGWMEGCPVPLL